MSTKTSEILLHPVRLRIILAIGTDSVTTADLRERLPDIPQATLYRQIARLVDGGLLDVVEERRVRGSVERTYEIVSSAVQIGPEESAAMTSEDHLRGFITFVGALTRSVAGYLEQPGADPGRDGLGYRQAALWLDDAERARLIEELGAVLAPYLALETGPGKQRLLLNTIVIPDVVPAPGEDR